MLLGSKFQAAYRPLKNVWRKEKMDKLNSKTLKFSSNSKDSTQSDGIWGFFILTSVLTIIFWGIPAVFQMSVINTADTSTETTPLAMLLLMLGGFVPSIAGLIMAYRANKRAGLRDLWKRFLQFNLGAKWYLVMIVIPVIIAAGTMVMYALQGGVFVRPEFLNQPVTLIPLVISIFIGGPLSEEFGWRGFALDRLQTRWGVIKSSIILGLAWAVWHLPLFLIPGTGQYALGNPALMFPIYVFYVIGMTIAMTWAYNNTKRSIWGAIFFHFTLNFTANIQLLISELKPRSLYIGNAIMTIFVAAILIVLIRNNQNG
jgi:membrane protease YdiL (CAAX protease family)